PLLDEVQAIFESATGREIVGFIAAAGGRTEVRDGNGLPDLKLDYPIAAVTSVKLGYDSATPDEILAVGNKRVLVFGVGQRRLSRVDGGVFGAAGRPRYVEVIYDHQGDMPTSAKLAIESVAATAYQRRGSEELRSETVGNFYSRTTLRQIADEDPF